jgi:hypothetical protein
MKLFVANPTKQHRVFTYRLPHDRSSRHMPIPAGGQVCIHRDLAQSDLAAIVDQNLKYGLVEASQVNKRGPVPEMIYAVDREVPMSKIMEGFKAQEKMLIERGQDARTKGAIAIQQSLSEQFASVDALEMEIVEEDPRGGRRDDDQAFSEGVIVGQTQEKAERAARGRRRAG